MENNINKEKNTVSKSGIKVKTLMILIIVATTVICAIAVPLAQEAQYRRAVKLYDSGDYVAAYEMFEDNGEYKDSADKRKACIYGQAMKYVEKKKYIKAYEKLLTIKDYGDAQIQMGNIFDYYKDEQLAIIKSAKKGDIVTFGEYEGKGVSWIVLDKKDDKSFLLSEKSLLERKFNEEHDITWVDSEIREWLNDTFYKNTFVEREKAMIQTSKIDNLHGLDYSDKTTKPTKDKIFLLSLEEVNKYYPTDESKKCKDISDSGTAWYLRSQGKASFRALYVSYSGEIDEYGCYEDEEHGIRPAVWISIK